MKEAADGHWIDGIKLERCPKCGGKLTQAEYDFQYHEACPKRRKKKMTEAVDHPAHYGGKDDPYEAIKVIEAWQLNFNLGNTVKYISRAGKKDKTKLLEDLKKSAWYLNREIETLEREKTR